ncbi:hypothetical protein GEMRC1_011513 [Eukaryota sp. GEM-RC1]
METTIPISLNGSPNPMIVVPNSLDEPLLSTKLLLSVNRTYWEFFFITLACFSCYASMFFFQRYVSDKAGFDHGNVLLGVAISLLAFGNLIFRLAHNILFAFLSPRHRLVLAMTIMLIVEATLFSLFKFADKIAIWQVGLCYGLAGMGIGTFESNIMNVATAYGKKAKMYGLYGIPFGIASVTVLSRPIMNFFDWSQPTYIYFAVGTLQILCILLLLTRVDVKVLARQGTSASDFMMYLSEWRRWFFKILPYALTMGVNMFAVSSFSPGIELYVFTDDVIVVDLILFKFSLANHYFFSLFSLLFCIGDFSSRIVFDRIRLKKPYPFLLFTVSGVFLGLLKVPVLALCCGFLVSFGNGGIYTTSSRTIDQTVDSRYNGIAYSFWLFISDSFSVLAYVTTQYIRDILVPPTGGDVGFIYSFY